MTDFTLPEGVECAELDEWREYREALAPAFRFTPPVFAKTDDALAALCALVRDGHAKRKAQFIECVEAMKAYGERAEQAEAKLAAVEGERNIYHHALEEVIRELGVPGDGYPQNVANAYEAAAHAIALYRDQKEDY